MNVDKESGNLIRKTDNGLKEGDIESPQHSRPLTAEEIKALIAKGVEQNGDS